MLFNRFRADAEIDRDLARSSPMLRQTDLHLNATYRRPLDGVAAILYRTGDDFRVYDSRCPHQATATSNSPTSPMTSHRMRR